MPNRPPFRYLAIAFLPLAGSFADELRREVEATWNRVAGAALDNSPYRDKARFASRYADLKEEHSPSQKDLAEALRFVESLGKEHGSDPHFRWRADELAAALLWDSGRRKEGLERSRAALDGYPDERYADPIKLSSFQHLANETAGRIWEEEGVEAAEAFILERFREDARFAAFYVDWWEERYAGADASSRLEGLVRGVLDTYAEKAKADPSRRRLLEGYAEQLAKMSWSEERRVGDDPKKKYFLLGNPEGEKPGGRKLVLVMPGGHGQAREFLSFLGDLHGALGEGFVFAVLSAPQWNPEQAENLVWPTERSRKRFREVKFSTESFLRAVHDDVKAKASFEISKAFVFGWSSSGPAVYAASTEKEVPYDGYYVLASVFRRDDLRLNSVRGRRYYLQQGTEDRVTALHWAQTAEETLKNNGAVVKLDVYEGGHGFAQPSPFDAVRSAFDWLESGK